MSMETVANKLLAKMTVAGQREKDKIIPSAPICTATLSATPQLDRFANLCKKWEKNFKNYIYSRPLYSFETARNSNLRCLRDSLVQVNNAVISGDEGKAKFNVDSALECLTGLYSIDISENEAQTEALEKSYNILKYIGPAAAGAAAVVGGGALIAYGVGLCAPIAISAAELGPLYATALYAAPRFAPRARQLYYSATNVAQNLIYGTAPLFERLNRIGVIREPNLKGLNDSVMTIYGTAAISSMLVHAGDEMGSEPAVLPGEEILGKASRKPLGIYGNIGITYLLGIKLFNFSPWAATAFVTGHVISEYRVQHNSNAVSIDEVDWMRMWGGAVSSLLTYGPMNWLWNGVGPWIGWANKFPKREVIAGVKLPVQIPAFRATAGFVTTSGLVNSALFVPIALWLERANLKNFWTGLTVREFTLAVPRKAKQSLVNPNSILGVAIYHLSKIVENEIISRFFSLFAGSGMYRAPMHRFLAEEHSADEFIEFCLKGLASCKIPICDGYVIEQDDFDLIAKDIKAGEFSAEEQKKIRDYIREIMKSKQDADSKMIADAWREAFKKAKLKGPFTDGEKPF